MDDIDKKLDIIFSEAQKAKKYSMLTYWVTCVGISILLFKPR